LSDPKLITSLKIYRGGIKAGTLVRTNDGCEFVFDPSFIQDQKYNGLSFSMPKRDGAYRIQGVNLHPFFAGLLPEGLRLKSILTNLKTSQDDLFSLFAAVSSNTVGDVYAITEDLIPANRELPKLKQINFFEYFEKLIKINSYALGEDSLAGIQEKISASVISFPLNIAKADRSYILKLNPKDKSNLVENELFSMRLAHLCGIKTANVKLVRDKLGNKGLLVERFDRVKKGDHVLMQHQEDFCQVMDRYPSDKYRLTLSDVIKGVKPFLSAEGPSILKILKIFAFSYLLGNGDLHAKNMSLLTQENKLTDISPSYDLLTTYIYGDFQMATKLDGKDDNIKRGHIVAIGERFGLNKLATERMLTHLVRDFYKNYLILKQIPMEKKKWIFFAKMITKRLSDLS
jgi:serine/threonine-protein kinase HipA